MKPAVATATKRQKNAFDRFVKKLGQKAQEREARAAVVAAAQDDILSLREQSKTIGTQAGHLDEPPWDAVGNGSKQSTGIDAPSWWERRQDRCSEFEGLGYGAKFSQYAFAKAAASMQAPDRSHSERRETRRQSRMQEGGEIFLAFEAFGKFCAANGMTPMSSGGGTSEVDHDVAAALLTSKNLSPEGFSAVDSGTTLTIMDLAEDMFVDFAKSRSTKIMGFDGNVTRSRGGGTVVGYAMSSEGRRVELRIPHVHSVQGAPHDLLSVSGLVLLGYEFYFTQARSYVVTPELEILDLLQKGGLYWLKWTRAVDPDALHRKSSREAGNAEAAGNIADCEAGNADAAGDVADSMADEAVSSCTCCGAPPHGDHDSGFRDEADDELSSIERPNVQKSRDAAGMAASQSVGASNAKANLGHCSDPLSCQFCGGGRDASAPLSLMHRRLAHWSEDTIVKMVKNRALDVTLTSKARCVCQICRVNKATRKHVSTEREAAAAAAAEEKPFERVWTDLKGKVVKDFWGNQYMITFTCEVNRWTCVYFMKKKSEAKVRLREFLKWVSEQGFTVRKMNSDGGGEFTADENAQMLSDFQQICVDHHIEQQFTSAHTPEQNGVSERLNRTLVEHARCLLHEAGLAPQFWSMAVKHVTYIRNRLWHSKLESTPGVGCSPFQALYGRVPRFGMVRVWGCDAWKLDHSFRSSSFGKKATKAIFVGMSANRKGWVLFDPVTRKVRTTYHCSFDESLEGHRCSLRDFDLREAKAGDGASRDEERLAQLERQLYDKRADLLFDGHKIPIRAPNTSDIRIFMYF